MGASTGARSPVLRASSVGASLDSLRAQLRDPQVTTLAIATLTLLTFVLVRVTGGAPNAIMELGYAPVALAAYTFGRLGGVAAGLAVGAVLGPVPSLLGFDRVEGPAEWLIRSASFAGIGALIGQMLDRSATEASRAHKRLVEVAEREKEGLLALARAAESRDLDAGEHVRRLELTSRRLAEQAGMEPRTAAALGWSAMLHDIGKLRVPDRILLKPQPLDPDEWRVIRNHPIWSEQALGGGDQLALAREIARSHHENWDGTGYPDGLYGDRIPLAARVVRIADAFDAMTNRRPYQMPVSFEAALEEIQAASGRDYDPDLVGHFIELVRSDADLRRVLTELHQQ